MAQTLLAGAGGARGARGARGDGRGAGRGQRVGEVALAPDLPPEARRFVHLGQRREVHDVVVSVRAQVRRALAGLVAVLQEDGGASLVRGPPPFVVDPLPVNTTAEAGGLGEQGPAYRPGLS